MGRNDRMTIKQYGRHRQRVVLADNWSGSDSKEDVFSCSSNSASDSMNSNTSSYMQTRSRNYCDTSSDKQTRSRNYCDTSSDRQTRNRNKQLTASVPKNSKKQSRNRGVDKENQCVKQFKGKGKREKRKCTGIKCLKTCNGQQMIQSLQSPSALKDSVNFSEFDEYSLLVELGTSNHEGRNQSKRASKSSVETSTPCRKSRPMINSTEIKDVNISVIDYVESPLASSQVDIVPGEVLSPVSALWGVSEIISSLSNQSVFITGNSDISLHQSDASRESVVDGFEKQMPKLLTPPEIRPRSVSPADRFQESQDLFDSLVFHSTDSKPVTSPLTCVVHLQKLKDRFMYDMTNQRNNNIPIVRSRNGDSADGSDRGAYDCDRGVSVDEGVVELEEEEEEVGSSESTDEDNEDFDLSDIEEDEEEDDSEYVNSEEDADNSSPARGDEESLYMLTDNFVAEEWINERTPQDEMSLMELSMAHLSLQREASYQTVNSVSEYEMSTSQIVTANSTRNDCPSSPKQHLHCTSCDSITQNSSVHELSFAEILTPGKNDKAPMSPKAKIYDICEQTNFIPFNKCIPNSVMKTITKIGEGVFGEVFRATRDGQSVAIKIVPIEGNQEVNDEPQKNFGEILSEVVISRELSNLRKNPTNTTENFCEVKCVSCVQGSYPAHLLKQWDAFDKAKKSENDRPDIFPDDQLFMVFEFADGGRDLESFQFDNPFQAKSVLQQVCMSLAVAEDSLEFEHRDLHIGNVLVCEVDHPTVTCRLCDKHFEIQSHGVHVSIIDFTLSRLRKDGCIVFCDLAKDDSLYEGTGDYQFDIYRKMKEENNNIWKPFNSHSNVLWIHYLCDKILRRKKYKRNGREDRNTLRDLRLFFNQALKYDSAKHILLESNLFQT
ncbi:uncharacterized protein LOC121383939 isoform X2 [Gigantopelta aegis]|uniref:uncharacterized protein LOC121383939 isoform X2 n=1 Tax=Gigantopelta aegis TaxID=1735272 RepID=UPI001B88B1A6|nr:uncharacterized protein LOC121383939 isoform X2 [Gigantopelta aegis]